MAPTKVKVISTVDEASSNDLRTESKRHLDYIDSDETGWIRTADLVNLVKLSHQIESSLTLRYLEPEIQAWAIVPDSKIEAFVGNSGELFIEVKAQLLTKSALESNLARKSQLANTVQSATKVKPKPEPCYMVSISESSSRLELEDFHPNKSVESLSAVLQRSYSDHPVSRPLKYGNKLEFSSFNGELWSAEEYGKVHDPWLIVERVENVAMDPKGKKANRTVRGAAEILKLYRTLFLAASNWFESESELNHPQSNRIFGAEGSISITPEKLLSFIPGLSSYFVSQPESDRVLLLLAARKASFEQKNILKVPGKWKRVRAENWDLIPGLAVADYKWEDNPGQYWNDSWQCYLQTLCSIQPAKGSHGWSAESDSNAPCLAILRFVKLPEIEWKKPVFPIKVPGVVSDVFLDSSMPSNSGGYPLDKTVGKISSFSSRNIIENALPAKSEHSKPDWLPPPTRWPQIQVEYLDGKEIDFDSSQTMQGFEQMTHSLLEIEEVIEAGAGSNLPQLLTSIDRLAPIHAFLADHKEDNTFCFRYYSKSSEFVKKALDIVHAEFIRELKPPSSPAQSPGDLLERLHSLANDTGAVSVDIAGLAPGLIPELPEHSQAKRLNSLLVRLRVQDYRPPQNTCTFKSVRTEALSRNLWRLGMHEMRAQQVLELKWEQLQQKMQLWMKQIRVLVTVLLPAERQLCESVLSETVQWEAYSRGGMPQLVERCFLAIARNPLQRGLDTGSTLATGNTSPEKILPILDMFSLVRSLEPSILLLFRGKGENRISRMLRDFYGSMGTGARASLVEFKQRIDLQGGNLRASSTERASKGPAAHLSSVTEEIMSSVGVDALTSYVVNYLNVLTSRERGYKPVLKLIFRHFSKGFVSDEVEAASSISGHFMAIILALKSALLGKACRIEDECLRYFYIINNWSYIDDKSKWRETGRALGEQEEMTLRIDDIVNILTSKMENEVFGVDAEDGRQLIQCVTRFNSELMSLLTNKIFLLTVNKSVQSKLLCRLAKRVSGGYAQFLQSNKFLLSRASVDSRANYMSKETVDQRLSDFVAQFK